MQDMKPNIYLKNFQHNIQKAQESFMRMLS